MTTLLIAIFLGGVAQRATGMGPALVAAPFIVVALGPAAGVVVANLLGVAGSTMAYARVRHAVDWRMLRLMLPAALVGVGVGTVLAELLPEAWAQVFIGALALVALLVSSFGAFERLERTPNVTAVASAASGTTSALAGIGGRPWRCYASCVRGLLAATGVTIKPVWRRMLSRRERCDHWWRQDPSLGIGVASR